MANGFHLVVITPYGRYYDDVVDFLEVRSEDYSLGILPGHAPLVSTLSVCKMTTRHQGRTNVYAIGGGVININKEQVTLILDSIERSDEIDLVRAKEAKRRAEERLEQSKKDETIDVSRAKLALLKALNRIGLASKD